MMGCLTFLLFVCVALAVLWMAGQILFFILGLVGFVMSWMVVVGLIAIPVLIIGGLLYKVAFK